MNCLVYPSVSLTKSAHLLLQALQFLTVLSQGIVGELRLHSGSLLQVGFPCSFPSPLGIPALLGWGRSQSSLTTVRWDHETPVHPPQTLMLLFLLKQCSNMTTSNDCGQLWSQGLVPALQLSSCTGSLRGTLWQGASWCTSLCLAPKVAAPASGEAQGPALAGGTFL